MAEVQTLLAKDVNSSKLAYAYLTIDNKRKLLMMATKLEAKAEKNKQEVAILGKTSKGHKTSSVNYTGSLTVYQVSPLFIDMIKKYQDTGVDMYFDIQVVNEDPTSASGRQTVILKGCNIDSAVLTSFDADSDDWLQQDIDFTFESFEVSEKYTELSGVDA